MEQRTLDQTKDEPADRYLDGGVLLRADATDAATVEAVRDIVGSKVPLIVADPPYGKIVKAGWDQKVPNVDAFVTWMLGWTTAWSSLLEDGGAFYIWGGIGRPRYRPFFRFLSEVESKTELTVANLITWHKRRGYGVQNNYLFTREECAYLIKGNPKKPRRFNIPYLDEKRGYEGYDPEHPAKSEYFRRTNVWRETEILRGRLHDCQKADRVSEIPIEVHTEQGEFVIDLFAGSASTSAAAKRLDRLFVGVENDPESYAVALKRCGEGP